MRKRFTRAFYAVSAAAVITASLGLGAGAASAATTSHNGSVACGGGCFNLFSARLGSNITNNAYVAGDTGAGGHVGVKVNLHIAGNYRPNGDFTPTAIGGTVTDFCGVFWPDTAYVCTHYPSAAVYEVQFTPNGYGTSNLCAGVRSPSYQGENVTLQPCGESPATLWIADSSHAVPAGGSCSTPVPQASLPINPGETTGVTYCPWINGDDVAFSHPLSLTVNTGTTRPTNQLTVTRMQLLSGSVVPNNQLFAWYMGVVPF
ncbi:MAG: hypothetical protein ACYCO9_08255 [Streptosporangiaceae bacterium]